MLSPCLSRCAASSSPGPIEYGPPIDILAASGDCEEQLREALGVAKDTGYGLAAEELSEGGELQGEDARHARAEHVDDLHWKI